MLTKSLICYANTGHSVVQCVNVDLEQQPQGDLHLKYVLTGDLTQIRIPVPQPPIAVDGLWEHTCFEVFVAVEGDPGYHEFNFSPSSQWAAYLFSDYRVRKQWTISQAPIISFSQNNGLLHLEAFIAAADLPQNIAGKPLQIAVTAVIEASDGSHTYWSLHHPEARPDFHHRAGFILSLNQ